MARIALIVSLLTALLALFGFFQWAWAEWKAHRVRKKGMWLGVFLFMLLPTLADAACNKSGTIFTCSGDLTTLKDLFRSDIPSAILEGDTIHVTSGTWLWTGPLVAGWISNLPGFTFEGEGEGTTIFKVDTGYSEAGTEFGGMMVFVQQSASGLTTLRNFTNDQNDYVSGQAIVMLGSGVDKFRVHHVTCDNAKGRCFATYGNKSGSTGERYSGLFDHVTCNSNGNSVCFSIHGSWSGGNITQFDNTKVLGSNNSVYVEDSVCNFTASADDCSDGSLGGNLVVRFSTLNYGIGVHGADSTFRANQSNEFYRNTFTNAVDTHAAVNYRGGVDISFDNTYHADFINHVISYYRTSAYTGWGSFGESPARGKCDGTSTWDGNLGSGTPSQSDATPPVGDPGWPCLDQIGWYFPSSAANGSGAVYQPTYIWRNTFTIGGAHVPFSLTDSLSNPPTASDQWSTNYAVLNRDYYHDKDASCTGGGACTSGVGVGTTLPTSCTTNTATNALAATRGGGIGGVAFWKTNEGDWNHSGSGEQGVLYKCIATDTWAPYYTPYIYPHPLQEIQSSDAGTPLVIGRVIRWMEILLPIIGVAFQFRKVVLASCLIVLSYSSSIGSTIWMLGKTTTNFTAAKVLTGLTILAKGDGHERS